MALEIEVKFLDIDHDTMRTKLREAGAELEHASRLMRRHMFDSSDYELRARQARLRVRDEGDKLTITYKAPATGSEYSQEIETTVGDYQAMCDLLEAIGMHAYSMQESKRETWHLDDVEIVLDEWPWVPPYMEIEGPSEPAIKDVSAKLGLNWSDAVFGDVDEVYKTVFPKIKRGEGIGRIAEVKFGAPVPQWFEDRR